MLGGIGVGGIGRRYLDIGRREIGAGFWWQVGSLVGLWIGNGTASTFGWLRRQTRERRVRVWERG
jgi:hypothetical protein